MFGQTPSSIRALLFLLSIVSLQAFLVSGTNRSFPISDCLGLDACRANVRNGKRCGVLPIPPQARLPSVVPGSFVLTMLRTGIWAYEDGAYNSLMLFRFGHLVLVDFPDSQNSNTPTGTGTLLTNAILNILGGSKPRRIDMIYSHDHFDHIGAAKKVYNFLKKEFPNASIRIWGTLLTKQTIEDSSSKRAIVPTMIIDEMTPRSIYMGDGMQVEMFIIGGHSGRDLAVYIPPSNGDQGVLMLVDIVYPKWAPFSSFAATEDFRDYVRAHERALKIDFGSLVAGHMRIGTKQDVQVSLDFVNDVIEAARKALRTTSREDFARAGFGQFVNTQAIEFGNLWYAFVDVVLKVQTQSCAHMVLGKWGCKLGGIGVVAESHCLRALDFAILSD